jgi:threonine synthase
LETAHPVKFFDVVEPVIHEQIPIPESVRNILGKEKLSISMEPDYEDLKAFLLNK